MYLIKKINNLSEFSKNVLIGLLITVTVVVLVIWLILRIKDGTLGESVSQIIGISTAMVFSGLSAGYIENSKE